MWRRRCPPGPGAVSAEATRLRPLVKIFSVSSKDFMFIWRSQLGIKLEQLVSLGHRAHEDTTASATFFGSQMLRSGGFIQRRFDPKSVSQNTFRPRRRNHLLPH
jgi:hypothetical protein